MAIINLRKHYYPLYTKDTFIEVPDEIAAVMEECRLYENRQEGRKSYYHVYSMDCSPGIENHAMFLVQSPEDLIIREIDEAAEELLLERLAEAISQLSPTQVRRLHARYTEIMLPSHAPPEFADRSTLWNSVEQIEKSSTAQLAREIEVALPVELSRAEQLALVRAYVKDNFVSVGMCADFAIHDKGTGNPHAHILLTIRPIKENGEWGAKCRKVYDLDSQGQRIPDGKGGWKSHREDTTDWNQRGNAEKWRAAWASYANRALEATGRPERIDHRSYKRQGIDKIPSIHMGPAASQMERRGVQTVKGNINREIAADNKLLKEIKARITRLYNWSKEQSAQPQESIMDFLFQARQDTAPTSQYARVKALKENVALFNFLQANGISSMPELYEKVSAINSGYYDLRGKIVKAERRLTGLNERLEMWAQYQKYKPVRQELDKVAPAKREQFEQRHSADLALFDAAVRYLDTLKASGEAVTPKAWRAEAQRLTAEKEADYLTMRAMREDIKVVETLKKTADRLAKEGQTQRREEQER